MSQYAPDHDRADFLRTSYQMPVGRLEGILFFLLCKLLAFRARRTTRGNAHSADALIDASRKHLESLTEPDRMQASCQGFTGAGKPGVHVTNAKSVNPECRVQYVPGDSRARIDSAILFDPQSVCALIYP